MKTALMTVLLLVAGITHADPVERGSAQEAMALFVGEWRMQLETHEESFGDRAGRGVGTMECSWGPARAWVDCEMDSEYSGFGSYHLKLVLYRTAEPDVIGTFVTNSFGGGRLYLGRRDSSDRIVFVDAWVDPERKWEHQRTTYKLHDDDRISYMIEVSHDGVGYLPHSSGTYRRR